MVDDSLETSVPGIFACGNVLHVHDLVDHVSAESFRAGKAAAAFVRSGKKEGSLIEVADGDGVRGTVPQLIRRNTDEDVSLMFRPSAVFRNSTAVVECGGQAVCSRKALVFTPGEMATVVLKKDLIRTLPGNRITVRIERN